MIVIPTLGGGGAERCVLNFIESCRDDVGSIDILLVTLLKYDAVYQSDRLRQIRSISIQASHTRSSVIPLARVINSERPHVILAHLPSAIGAAAAAMKISLSKAALFSVVHSAKAIYGSGGMFERLAVDLGYRLSRKIITVSRGIAQSMGKMNPALAHKLMFIENPVVTEALRVKSEEVLQTEESEQISRKKPVVLGIGRLSQEKRFDVLIDAFALFQKNQGGQLLILGEGPLRGDLQNQIDRLQLRSSITLLGFRDNPYRYLKNADLFVLSSDYEGMPTVLIEALAIGTKCVSVDCPTGPGEILGDRFAEYLCPVGDFTSLAACMTKAMTGTLAATELQALVSGYDAKIATGRYLDVMKPFLHGSL